MCRLSETLAPQSLFSCWATEMSPVIVQLRETLNPKTTCWQVCYRCSFHLDSYPKPRPPLQAFQVHGAGTWKLAKAWFGAFSLPKLVRGSRRHASCLGLWWGLRFHKLDLREAIQKWFKLTADRELYRPLRSTAASWLMSARGRDGGLTCTFCISDPMCPMSEPTETPKAKNCRATTEKPWRFRGKYFVTHTDTADGLQKGFCPVGTL